MTLSGAGVESTVLTCDLWCDPNDVRDAVDGLSFEDAWDAVAEASWALNQLLDDAYHPPCCFVERHKVAPGGCEIKLGHGPVVTVKDVFVVDPCDESTQHAADNWCYRGARVISTNDRASYPRGTFGIGFDPWFITGSPCQPCGLQHTYLEVVFSVESTLPPGARRVAKKYAIEIARSGLGLPCELPARMTTVTRQGVSWTIAGPTDFLTSGLTGVDSVDAWIATARRGLGGTIIDPLQGSMISCMKYCCDTADPDDPPGTEVES